MRTDVQQLKLWQYHNNFGLVYVEKYIVTVMNAMTFPIFCGYRRKVDARGKEGKHLISELP